MKKTLLAIALGGLVSSAAFADPFYIDLGTNRDSDADTHTAVIRELGYTGTLATSIYLADPTISGTNVPVIDTNITSILNSYGFGGLAGSNGFVYPDVDARNIDGLNYEAGQINPKAEGFRGSSELYGDPAVDGLTWGLIYDYVLYGSGNIVDGALFGGGYFDIFYTTDPDGAIRTQVARLNVLGSSASVGDEFTINVFGNVSFDFDGNGTNDAVGNSFVQNFFVDAESDQTFYDLWLAGIDAPLNLAVTWTLDTNIDCVNGQAPENNVCSVAEASYLDQDEEDATSYMRQTYLDGSLRFAVPEPGSLALLGLGLAGMGLGLRRRKSA